MKLEFLRKNGEVNEVYFENGYIHYLKEFDKGSLTDELAELNFDFKDKHFSIYQYNDDQVRNQWGLETSEFELDEEFQQLYLKELFEFFKKYNKGFK